VDWFQVHGAILLLYLRVVTDDPIGHITILFSILARLDEVNVADDHPDLDLILALIVGLISYNFHISSLGLINIHILHGIVGLVGPIS
jgi:hypothetical protein